MIELKQYDIAAQKFYDTQQINSLPILSWDSYGLHFDRLTKFSRDIVVLNQLAKEHGWQSSLSLNEALVEKDNVIVVTDAKLKIVHASHNIIHMNGYEVTDIIGESPKMFQGKDTCKDTSVYISNAIKRKCGFEATILNYRKDGSPYKCWIKGEPLFNKKGKVVHFIAYEKEVA